MTPSDFPIFRIVFWQSVVSPHQSSVIRSLANSDNLQVTWVVEEHLYGWRKEMGWSLPDLGRVNLIVHPNDSLVQDLIETSKDKSVHIFSPNRNLPIISKAFHFARRTGVFLAIMSETYDPRGSKGLIRKIIGKVGRYKYQGDVDFILAIGANGRRWFKNCGWPENKIFDYGYVTETLPPPRDATTDSNFDSNLVFVEQPNLIFIGQLIKRKGLDIAIIALSRLNEFPWYLNIVGDGPERADLEKLAREKGVSERLNFLGALSNNDAITQLFTSDCLILPSRWDGWGAVVNEALVCGVPVVCSDKCGAAGLLDNDYRGHVFKSESVDGLKEILSQYISVGRLSVQKRNRIRAWSRRISGEAIADYLLNVVSYLYEGGSRPVAPWQDN